MSKADQLGTGVSFGTARPVSARRAAIAAVTSAPTIGAGQPTELPIHLISHNPDNPRESIGDVSALADTIREIGLVQSITVATVDAYLKTRPHRAGELAPGADYVVVDGNRRLAATQEAELTTIKATINDGFVASDEKLLEAAFVANASREDMSELEEAQALEKLVAFYGSQGKAAKRLGMTQANISQRLSLLRLAPDLQADLDSGRRKVEHVRGLARLSPEEQRAEADERAAAAERRAQGKRQARVEEGVQRAAPGPQATAAHNGVMTSASQPGTHNGVMGSSERGEASPASGARPAAGADDRGTAVVPPQAGGKPAAPLVQEMPWHNPVSCLTVASVHMTPENFEAFLAQAAKMHAQR